MLKLSMEKEITKSRQGMAMMLVIGLVAIVIPLLFLFSRLGSSQIKLAQKYQENLLAESIAFSGTKAGYSRLKGNIRGYQDLPEEVIGDHEYALNILPTGEGFFSQDLYYIMSSSKIKKHNYTLMGEAEQYEPQPSPPVLVITRDFWHTVEPYEINQMADVLSMQNYRGLDLLRFEETKQFEATTSPDNYRAELAMKERFLPKELKDDWSSIVQVLVEEKL
jgi:hypothetical protein